MKKLPLGNQSFRKIIEGGYVYVDKTKYIYKLVNEASYYFLSRPRRFGKSLLLDTISEVFNGDKELFEDLWIHDSGYTFPKYPVIRLDMSNVSTESSEDLKKSLLTSLSIISENEALPIVDEVPSDVFKRLIITLHKKYGQKVVVLVDEYDKPILDHILDEEAAEANRKVLRGFFGILKSMDPYLRFSMFTGVSKFAKTSIFSELNNLSDITLHEEYAGICGFGIDELDEYFGDHIENAPIAGLEEKGANLRSEILKWYDGYSWDGKTRLVNPFSLLSFFDQKRFSSFWYASGSPKFLMDLIKENPGPYSELEDMRILDFSLDTINLGNISLEPLLLQSGYLTIGSVEYDEHFDAIYTLRMPNYEVGRAFHLQVLSGLSNSGDLKASQFRIGMVNALGNGDLGAVLALMKSIFASIPYHIHVALEAYYHSVFYAALNVLGFDIQAEVATSRGRVDAILELGEKVYIFEFKYEDCPAGASEEEKTKAYTPSLDKAMDQIKAKGYYEKFIGRGKEIYLAAFAFLGRDSIYMKAEVL
ncbi:MAG: ATP-binding protein [Eubacteriaceae bacterium]|nr:ATP-binding protein [Eubacteriaceae bacterium]